MIPSIFFFVGMGLCLTRHYIWGVLCFVFALLAFIG